MFSNISFQYVSVCFFRHVLEVCRAVAGVREAEGIQSFLEMCRDAGMSKVAAYRAYIMGKDCHGVPIEVHDHLARGASLSKLTDAWLATWYEEENYYR